MREKKKHLNKSWWNLPMLFRFFASSCPIIPTLLARKSIFFSSYYNYIPHDGRRLFREKQWQWRLIPTHLFVHCLYSVIPKWKSFHQSWLDVPPLPKNEFSFALIDALWRSKWEKSEISPRYLSQSTQITMMKTSSIRLPLLYLVVMTLVILACPVILLLLAKTLLPPQDDQILELK